MSIKHVSRAILFGLAIAATGPALAQAGDATKGKAVFARCAVCHSVDPGVKKLGPSLSGVFGRTSGTVPGFTYSPAMQKAKIRWDAKSLDGFLAKPSASIPGSRMVFAGLPNPADRANLLAYLAGATKK